MELKNCPCGKTPKSLLLEHHSAKHWLAYGDCCNEWIVEVKIPWTAEEDERIRLASEAWNATPRSTTYPSGCKSESAEKVIAAAKDARTVIYNDVVSEHLERCPCSRCQTFNALGVSIAAYQKESE